MRLVTKDYVFKHNDTSLDFVGDFEGLYKNIEDPWVQSGMEY